MSPSFWTATFLSPYFSNKAKKLMNQMPDGCLIGVKTIGELSLGWPKGAGFYVVFVAGDFFWQFSEGCV